MPRAHTFRTVILLAIVPTAHIVIGCSLPTPSHPIVIPTIQSPAKVISDEERKVAAAHMRAYKQRQRSKRIALAENTGPGHSEAADAARRAKRNQEKRQAEEQDRKAAQKKAEAEVSFKPVQYCGRLHPEAQYMTAPDEDGTMYWMPKQVGDFADFASCFNQRYGGAFAPHDFRPCNSIPGISEDDRIKCLVDEERPVPRSWCGDVFNVNKNFDIWMRCTNEFRVLDNMRLVERSKPKTTAEMKQDEQDFMENASAYARDHYRACILQSPQRTDAVRQGCRDLARGSEKLSKSLHDFIQNFDKEMLREDNPLRDVPSRLTSPEGTY